MSRDLRTILGRKLLEEPLMQQALTHRSAAAVHNERIEFLGDVVLGLLISKLIYSMFPSLDEGKLTKLRSYLVKKETLARVAKQINILPLIIVGGGESAAGNSCRDSLLADTLEAVIGALYLLHGIDKAEEFIHEVFSDTLAVLPSIDNLKDAKSRLQEYLQKRGIALPTYEVSRQFDKGVFQVACVVSELGARSFGEAASKRKAEQQAAVSMLEKLLVYREK